MSFISIMSFQNEDSLVSYIIINQSLSTELQQTPQGPRQERKSSSFMAFPEMISSVYDMTSHCRWLKEGIQKNKIGDL